MFSSYFQKIAQYSPLRFIAEVTSLAFVSRFFVVLPIAILLSAFGVDIGTPNIESIDMSKNLMETIFYVVIFAPFFETLIFQLVPLNVLKFLRISERLSILLTTLLFAYVHLDDGLINFIGMLPIGFLFVWSFVVRQKKSIWQAIGVVFVIHALTNLLALFMYFLG